MRRRAWTERDNQNLRRLWTKAGGTERLLNRLDKVLKGNRPRRQVGRKRGVATYKIDDDLLPILPAMVDYIARKRGLHRFEAVKWWVAALRKNGHRVGGGTDDSVARRLLYAKFPASSRKSTYTMVVDTGYHGVAGRDVGLNSRNKKTKF